MKKSGTLTICGHDYTYRFVDDLKGQDGTGIDGHYKVTTNEVLVENELKGAYREAVFLHEIVHGILEHSGLTQDEHIANAIAYGLQSVKIDGKRLLR